MKLKEGKKPKKSFLDGIQKNLPALSYANSITLKASQTGFDWKSPEEVFDKIKEEISELENEMRSMLFFLTKSSKFVCSCSGVKGRDAFKCI